MIDYLLDWPFGLTETLALAGALLGVLGVVWRTTRRVEEALRKLEDGLQALGKASEERGEQLTRRVDALEAQMRVQTTQESGLVATLTAMQAQMATISARLDSLITALLKRTDR